MLFQQIEQSIPTQPTHQNLGPAEIPQLEDNSEGEQYQDLETYLSHHNMFEASQHIHRDYRSRLLMLDDDKYYQEVERVYDTYGTPPPGIGRSMQIRATVERHAWAQLAQGPWAPAQWAQTLPTSAPHTPQMALPLHQPPPGQPATLYQQAVQLPGKSTGRGVTFDCSIDKTAPAGSQSSEDHGRQRTRGWGDGGQSTSCPRGVQEKTSRQTPHQENDLPSRATPNIPPTTAPESTPPQWGGQARTLPRDPTQLATKYHSVGW